MNKNELIKVTTNEEGKQLVSARELYEFLEIRTRFNDWFSRMCEYGFVQDVDYEKIINEVCTQKRVRTYEQVDYAITLDMAKEISMIQRTEKGKQARQYFIECEKKLRESENNNKSQLTQEQQLALKVYEGGMDALTAHKKLLALKTKELSDKIVEQKEEIEKKDIEIETHLETIGEQKEEIETQNEEIKQLSPLAETLIKRFEKGENIGWTDVTKTFKLKRGQASKWAINNGYIYKNKKDVTNKGDIYFQRYVINGFKNICITPQGVQLIEQHLEEIKLV